MAPKRDINAAAAHAKEAVQDAAQTVKTTVKDAASKTAAEAEALVHDGAEAAAQATAPKEPTYIKKGKEVIHEAVETAKRTAEPYVDAAMKTAGPYVEAAKDASKPYVESAKAGVQNAREATGDTVQAARKAAEPYVEAARDAAKPYVEGAKASAANVRDHVSEQVEGVRQFDVTKTCVFVSMAQLVAYLIFTVMQLLQSSARLRAAEGVLREKADAAQVPSLLRQTAQTTRGVVKQVPVIGVRTVEIVDAFYREFEKALKAHCDRQNSMHEKKTA